MKTYSILIAAVALFLAAPVFAQHDTTAKVNQYGIIVEHHPLEPEVWNGIITFANKESGYRLWLDNRVYFDGAYFFDKKTYNPIGNGVTIRRARFAVKAKIKNWYGEIDLDFAGSETEMKDMIVGYIFPQKTGFLKNLRVKGGNFKEGFSMESTTTSRYVTFVERSLANTFAPSRHLGIQASKFGNRWLAIAGVHFQDLGGSEEVALSLTRNKKLGMDEGYSLTGRLVGLPVRTKEGLLHIGMAASYRTPKTSWEGVNGYRVSERAMSNINRKKYFDTDIINNTSNVVLGNVEIAGAYKNLMFQGEYTVNYVNGTDLDNEKGVDQAKFEGAYFQAGILLFGGRYQYNMAEGELTQIQHTKGGVMEIAGRYDYLKLNDFDAKIYGGGGNAYTIGIHYYATYNVSFKMDYSYVDLDRYANYRDKLFIGYDQNGDLTKDPFKVDSSKGTPGEKFGMIQLRCEIDF